MRLVRRTGSPGDLHALPFPEGSTEAEAWLLLPDRPAIVLGSAQVEATADAEAARRRGLEVVRRRSGGGAVFVGTGRCLWLDVVVPREDPRWSEDVRASTYWLGEAWVEALRRVGITADLYRGGLETTRWGRLVCFGALGPGEVVLDGRKTVGISQRRTRHGARFQCVVYDRWDPADVLDVLSLDEDTRRQATEDLAEVASGVGDRLTALEHAVVEVLVGR